MMRAPWNCSRPCWVTWGLLAVWLACWWSSWPHQLPDTFSETKHVTLSTLVCSCIWVTFIPHTQECPSQGHSPSGGLCHPDIRSTSPVLALPSQMLHNPSPARTKHKRTNAWQAASQVRKSVVSRKASHLLKAAFPNLLSRKTLLPLSPALIQTLPVTHLLLFLPFIPLEGDETCL